ncbi:KAP NTPase domain-containing protein [Vibrio chagasii]|nr:KAP NTPase domain-containing protein [Vibrio chagasii]CAH7329284.1 KAP NTPase domain-containing protein [Vibrio chagasii]CAH7444919.1 KAP NTPase domain-containing protein [Vibrio chagasii]CAH7461686.1 KAP NTPase domain-containing protein [Vibrio chagasii]
MTLPVPNSETFDKYKIIDNKPFSTHLTKFLNSKSDDGYVLNLNAEWGAGKTTFLQCWYNELSQNHPVVYFDAWKSDFSKDAMLALIDCFHAQLTSPLSDNKELIRKFFEKGGYFIRKSIPSLAAGVLKHQMGMSNDDPLIEDLPSAFDIDIPDKACGDALKEVLKGVLEQRTKVKGIEDFKAILESLSKAVIDSYEASDSPKQYPIYVLVDELDRCRPSYAIEVIENIKHFFDTKQFVFVVATDTAQLQHSIKAVYGNEFDAYSYLSRFFHKTITLPPPSTEQFLRSRLAPIIGQDFSLDDPHILQVLVNTFDWHNMTSLREIDKVIQDIELAKASGKKIQILPLTLLSILRRLHPTHYVIYTKNREFPYRPSNNSQKGTYCLPDNRLTPNIKLGDNAIVQVEHALYSILTSINSANTTVHWESILNKSVQSHNAQHGITTISLRYLLNEQGEDTDFSDYIRILELAGHFE